jgi:hypothetical protein
VSGIEPAKGKRWEALLATELRNRGWEHAEPNLRGACQRNGDILGVAGWFLSAKNHRALNLGGWVREAEQQAPSWRYAVLIKRRGYSAAAAGYAVLTVDTFLRLLYEADY